MIKPGRHDMKVRTTDDFQRERLSQSRPVGVINLGCARNLVDSQEILGRLKQKGHRIVDIRDADIAVVNTCSFIEEARKESIDTIVELVRLKKEGKLRKVIVAGCLAQRYGNELVKELPEIDAIIGTPRFSTFSVPEQVYLTPPHYAYVKICESCYNACSFCVIPKIKGKFTSRRIESVLEEVRLLDARGVREINIIGQDITAYGMDLYHEMSLARLLKEIAGVTKNIQWIRLLYTFPAHVTDELIDVIAGEPKICKYIDMPLQHISDPLLAGMNRNITTLKTRELIRKIRSKIPEGSLRTTFIVGLPGETEENFKELMDFVRETQFEKVGAFIYSREEGTKAYSMDGQVPEAVKRKRLKALMKTQQDISKAIQQRFVGRTLKVLITGPQEGEDKIYSGRSEFDAPEVDGIVYVHSKKPLKRGDLVDAVITDAYEYDLVGEIR